VLLVLWEYRVKPGHAEEFEALYRPDGVWTELLRQSPAFLSTTLWHDRRDPTRYVVADRWTSEVPYDEFVVQFDKEIAAMSERGRRNWDRETMLGRFDLLD
jgi:heme-degrading monooxygenase HmoA